LTSGCGYDPAVAVAILTCDNFLYGFKDTPYGRARRPALAEALSRGRITGTGTSWTSGRPAAGAGVEGGARRSQAAAWPAASSASAHRRGPLPPRGQPRTGPLAVPAVTQPSDRACKSQPGGPPAPGSLTPRKDHNQGRTSSLRCGRSTLILIFHGKIGACREDGAQSASHRFIQPSWRDMPPAVIWIGKLLP
jgi:hypothetical protein